MKRIFKTNLRCAACVATLRPLLDAEPTIGVWQVDLDAPGKPLTVEGASFEPRRVAELLAQAGYQSLGEFAPAPADAAPPTTSYYPLALVVAYVLGITGLLEIAGGGFVLGRAMANFMAGFFLAFSFFKLLDVRAFADSFANYDLLAARSRNYALAYPFVELALGAAYALRVQPFAANVTTLVLMLVGAAGVLRSLRSGQALRCVCLGTGFNLPMSTVTLAENLTMAAMAAAMLLVPALRH